MSDRENGSLITETEQEGEMKGVQPGRLARSGEKPC